MKEKIEERLEKEANKIILQERLSKEDVEILSTILMQLRLKDMSNIGFGFSELQKESVDVKNV